MEEGLRELLYQYSALEPRRRLRLPGSVALDADGQRKIHDQVLCHPIVTEYPPPPEYTREWLKWLVEHVERAGEEVHDELAERHAKLWQSDASEEEDLCYKTYWVAADVPITLLETRAFLSHGTTGLTSWEAAKFMTEYILNQSTLFKGKRVLELGCGVGLVAAALVKLARPQCVICTDASPLVLSLLERNLSLNNIKHAWLEDTTTEDAEVRLDVLDWTLASTEQLGQYAADVVVATDVMYDEAVAEPLARVLESQMSRPGTSAFIAYTLRNEDTVAAFFTALGKHGLGYQEVATEADMPQSLVYDRSFAPLRLIRIERRKQS